MGNTPLLYVEKQHVVIFENFTYSIIVPFRNISHLFLNIPTGNLCKEIVFISRLPLIQKLRN